MSTADERPNGAEGAAVPAISLPKGGGAIRGIGEKFAANLATGTGSISVPIATTPGRSGFGPQLSLSYDSGSGNGPFGFGWTLSIPAITRKTDKGLPQYVETEESDVFILSGSEDLVPVLNEDGTRYQDGDRFAGYVVHRYRPRVEGLFARIERWTHQETGDIHWRSITHDNVTTLYGKDANSRICDPAATYPPRIFSWLICESYDDKGNAIVYEYVPENDDNVHCTEANERNHVRTANRYVKRIKYGNRVSRLIQLDLTQMAWMFEVVFDYDEGHYEDLDFAPNQLHCERHHLVCAAQTAGRPWAARVDPFSSYRAGFEVRTYRRCKRVLTFHDFGELGDMPCLVRATAFDYADLDYTLPVRIEDELAHQGSTRFASFIRRVTQSGYMRDEGQPTVVRDGVTYATYLMKSLPPMEFEYSKAIIQDTIHELDTTSLENLPVGLDGSAYQWVDLDGEGVSGILTEQAGAWFYKSNLGQGRFGALKMVPVTPSMTATSSAHQQLIDLAGDGQIDLVSLAGPTPGFFKRTPDRGWEPFRAFRELPNAPWDDPNVRFIDLDGDGHADVLITDQDVFTWHPSLAEEGFGPSRNVYTAIDEEAGARLVFADGTHSIYLADMSGDGLSDLVRVRNGEVCYWPNLGYGRFGAKVTMDNAPWLDEPDQVNEERVRLADIDGSGTTDLLYLHKDGVRLYLNQSGNRWTDARRLNVSPGMDNLSTVLTTDLLGNGTACLVLSSLLPGKAPLRYVDLMGGQKPHLLVKIVNNLGAQTNIQYAPSTKFYLADKLAGRPWVTRIPFPVHVVERVDIYDHISLNRFVTCYTYHHGYFDGIEREFRGFGMVEQLDTEELEALTCGGTVPTATNVDSTSHVPPTLTKTWFHTGAYLGRDHISDFYAGLFDAQDTGEYYREPGLTDVQIRALLLPDSVLPLGLTLEEEREACRALKGSILRQEVFAIDGKPKEEYPYTVFEQNRNVRLEQPRGGNRHAVFYPHPRETITYHYERSFIVDPSDPEPNPDKKRSLFDPRVVHALILEVDPYGNTLKECSVGYGRRRSDHSLPLQVDRDKQTMTLITYTENHFTNSIDDIAVYPDAYRAPRRCETRTYELTGYMPTGAADRFRGADFVQATGHALTHVFDTEIDYENPPTNGKQRRMVEQIRTLYRTDDLTSLLPLGQVESHALPGESYKLAFTAGLLAQVFQRNGQLLLPDPAHVLGGQVADRGGYMPSQQLKVDKRFPSTDPDDRWWIPAGRVFLSPNGNDTAAQELAYAQSHFFLPCRMRDAFHTDTVTTESLITYDAYDLLMVDTRDALGNRVTVGERRLDGSIDLSKPGNDYRVLQPSLVMDPNRNRTHVALDALGMVAGTAVMGEPGEQLGDSLDGFTTDLTEAVTLDHLTNPLADPDVILGRATTRLVYDLFAYQRTKDRPDPQPAVVYTLARETHDADLQPDEEMAIQHSFSYSDGFGREIQKKLRAEPGPLVVGGPKVSPRWVGSGWTIFNNKGKPVRQYEPFFSATHRFEFSVQVGVSPILFYDPAGRVVATLHPNHTYEKVVFDAWQRVTWDANDTVLDDPRTDVDVRGYTLGYFANVPASPPAPSWETWHTQRRYGALGAHEQAVADKAAAHAHTPTAAYFDTLGRPFLTLADNGPDPAQPGQHLLLATRVELDIEGNQHAVRDAIEQTADEQGRIVMRYAYDMLSNRIHQLSMEAGARWMLNDVVGKPIRTWNSRGHSFRTEYDPLRRPIRSFVTGADPANPNLELLTERFVYGEQHPEAELHNLRSRLYLQLDQAGSVTTEALDFKGNPLCSSRRLTNGTQYTQTVDWRSVDANHVALPTAALLNPVALKVALAARLEPDAYTSGTTYDALNRPVMLTTPHTPAMQPSVVRPGYNEANLLVRVDANLRGASVHTQPVWTPFVVNIDYDAKGQRQRIDYGNGASTIYEYDPLTFRLVHLLTRRNAATFPGDCPQPPPSGWPGCQAQNLDYTYDPVGNVTHISDAAQQTIYFRNQCVEPSTDYCYDAIYRLIEATGREHLGQADTAIPDSHNDALRCRLPHPGDGKAMGRYSERFVYDAVGNIMEMRHRGRSPAHAGWRRRYAYDETSLIEDGSGGVQPKNSNRLSSTTVGSNPPESYVYDAHGSMTRMPHLGEMYPAPNMHWDYRDQLQQTNTGDSGTAYYVYDAAGQRVRKVWEKRANLTEERVYLAGFEIYRRRQGQEQLERETLHIMDDKQRIAMVETRTADTAGNDPAPPQLIRFQLANHLGSAILELDHLAQIISYEEYTPYGSTSYQAVRSQTETPKRYRYTGKERDIETGLYYHGARYRAPWLGCWTAADPAGLTDGTNLYAYVHNNPIGRTDPTGRQQLANDLDPKSPANFADFETFAQSYQETKGQSILQGELLSIWTSAHPLNSVPPDSATSTGANMGTVAAFAPISAWHAIAETYQPINAATGQPLQGPLLLYSQDAARTAAKAVPPGSGHMIQETVHYATADAAELALRAKRGLGPTARIDTDLYNNIWDEASRLAVRDATLGGRGVTSMNHIFNIEKLPSGVPTSDPLALSSSSIQARVEIPALRWSYGLPMAALGFAGGILTILGARGEEQPLVAGLGYVSGGLQVGGSVTYGVGAVFASGDVMAAGGLAVESGGILALPLLMYSNIKASMELQQAIQPEVNRMIEEGNYVGAGIMSIPPGGFW